MKQLYVIRHCKATGQEVEAPLAEEGRAQAEELAKFLGNKGIEMIVTSHFVRAKETAAPLAEQLNLTPCVDERLGERILADAQLDNWLECLKQTFEDLDLAFQGGEASRQAKDRAVAAVEDVLADVGALRVALVTHGNLATLLLKHFDDRFGFEQWAGMTNPDVYLVTVDGEKSRVERVWED